MFVCLFAWTNQNNLIEILQNTMSEAKDMFVQLTNSRNESQMKWINNMEANSWVKLWWASLLTEKHGCKLPYSGKLLREKTFANWRKIRFSRRKLSQIAQFCCAKGCHAPNFAEETFVYSHKTAKFAKKSFLLRKFSAIRYVCYDFCCCLWKWAWLIHNMFTISIDKYEQSQAVS